MKKTLTLILAITIVFSVNAQTKPKQSKTFTIEVDSTHAVQFLEIWRKGYQSVFDMQILAPQATVWYKYGDSVFNVNAQKYNSWIERPQPPKKDSTIKK